MSQNQIVNALKTHFNAQDNLPQYVFYDKFHVIENKGEGDCLFLSICQQDERYPTAPKLRKALCDFYKEFNFDMMSVFSESSLQYKLCMQYLADNIEYNARTGTPNKKTHIERICRSKEYAGIMDILAIAIILKRPIVLFNNIQTSEDATYEEYNVEEYTDVSVQNNPPILIRYDGAYHYEALKNKPDTSLYHTVPTVTKPPAPPAPPSPKRKTQKTKSPKKNSNSSTRSKSKSKSKSKSSPRLPTPPPKKAKTTSITKKAKKPTTKTTELKPKDYIGTKFVKIFIDETGEEAQYIGTVKQHPTKKTSKLFYIEYDDGDTEEMNSKQFSDALKNKISDSPN